MKKIIRFMITMFVFLLSSGPVKAESNDVEQYWEYAQEIGADYGICPELIFSMMKYESSYNPNIVSEDGAVGLMQVMPKYNQDRMARLGVTDLYDPYSNILVGTDLLADLATRYEPYEALTAYNCGENSKTLEKVQNGGSWEYADEILEYSAEMERKHE